MLNRQVKEGGGVESFQSHLVKGIMFKSRHLLFYLYHITVPDNISDQRFNACENVNVDCKKQLNPCSPNIYCVSVESSEVAEGISK